jgi:hypothetical protein
VAARRKNTVATTATIHSATELANVTRSVIRLRVGGAGRRQSKQLSQVAILMPSGLMLALGAYGPRAL